MHRQPAARNGLPLGTHRAVRVLGPEHHEVFSSCLSDLFVRSATPSLASFGSAGGTDVVFMTKVPIEHGGGGQTQGPRADSPLHLVLSGPAPCFYPAAAPSSLPLLEE